MKFGSGKIKYPGRIFAVIFLLLTVLIVCIIGFIIAGANFRGEKLMESGAYLEAAEQYSRVKNEDMAQYCMELYNEQLYLQAKEDVQSGLYDKARKTFVELGGYKDSAGLVLSCDFMKAEALVERGKYYEARELCLRLEGYPGQEKLLERCCDGIYKIAMELALSGKYAEACEQWQQLGDFKDSLKLVFRGRRMLEWLDGDARYIVEDKLYPSSYYKNVYKTDLAYIVVPEDCSRSCKFFVYYPGGTDEEINIDFLNYYLMNPAPDTLAVFMRRNGLKDMENKNSQALEILERTAAECGVFVREIMVVGSSMGAYPAMHSPRYTMQELGIKVDCVLSLDAGADWDTVYALRQNQCLETAELGTAYYLFESPWVGMNRPAIIRMVESGMDVTMVGCVFDEHVRITLDAMGMGVLHWALGDRTEPCELNIYSFNKLSNE